MEDKQITKDQFIVSRLAARIAELEIQKAEKEFFIQYLQQKGEENGKEEK